MMFLLKPKSSVGEVEPMGGLGIRRPLEKKRLINEP